MGLSVVPGGLMFISISATKAASGACYHQPDLLQQSWRGTDAHLNGALLVHEERVQDEDKRHRRNQHASNLQECRDLTLNSCCVSLLCAVWTKQRSRGDLAAVV